MKKICCIFNYAPHYREAIYKQMEQELDCDFYFGNKVQANIKKLDYKIFSKPVKELKNIWFFNRIYWIKGSVNLLFKPYKKYLLTGETICLSNWVLLFVAKLLNKKTYVWSHGWHGGENGVETLIKKLYFFLVDEVFLYGVYARDLMIKQGISQNKLHVIYNSLDYKNTLAVRQQLKETNIYKEHFLNDYPVLIFIGRLAPAKKLDLLLAALKKLNDKKVFTNLVLVGNGNELQRLMDVAKELNLDEKVWFYGQTYNENEIGELIFNADICVSPGNVGLTGIHSLTYGTPVITHDSFPSQMPEFEVIEDGINGAFFRESDIDSLVTVIYKWLADHPQKSEYLKTKCHQRIDYYYNPNFQIKVLKEGMKIIS